MVALLNKYLLGDMECHYYLDDETKAVELVLVPSGMELLCWKEKKQVVDSLVQIKAAGMSIRAVMREAVRCAREAR